VTSKVNQEGIAVMDRRTISRNEAIRIIAQAREAVSDERSIIELLEDWGAHTVFDALLLALDGVGNGFLSQVCETIVGARIEVTGVPAPRLPCPCCSRMTLTERYDMDAGTGYDVCDYCGWEDDGTSDEEAQSSVNRGSMAEYRARIANEDNYYDRRKWKKLPNASS
jgi:hypothetical protein